MPGISDVLKQIFQQFATNAPQSVGDALQSHVNPQMYQAEVAKRQRAQEFMQQLQLHNTLTPYQKAEIAHQNQQSQFQQTQADQGQKNWLQEFQANQTQHEQQSAQQKQAGQIAVANLLSNPKFRQSNAQYTPAAPGQNGQPFNIAGQNIEVTPMSERSDLFAVNPAAIGANDPAVTNVFGSQTKYVPSTELNDILNSINNLKKTNQKGAFKPIDPKTLYAQVDAMGLKGTVAEITKAAITDALATGDAPGNTKALAIMKDLADEARGFEAKFGPNAIKGQATLAAAEADARVTADNNARLRLAKEQETDEFPVLAKNLQSGLITPKEAFSKMNTAGGAPGKEGRFLKWADNNSVLIPTPLNTQSLKVLETTQPFIDQTSDILAQLQEQKRKDPASASKPFQMTGDRLRYWAGISSPLSQLISELELNKVGGAARVMASASRAVQALKLAMEHLPKPGIDSVDLMIDKMGNLQRSLNDIKSSAVKYGNKNGIVIEQGAAKLENKQAVDATLQKYGIK